MSRSKIARAKMRKALDDGAKDTLCALSDEELNNLRHEISREMNRHGQTINDLRTRLELIRMEMERRSETTPSGIRISDHAVVRYLQRCKGMDIATVRGEIETMALRSKQIGTTGRHTDKVSGVMLAIEESTTTVTTIFNPGEESMMKTLA